MNVVAQALCKKRETLLCLGGRRLGAAAAVRSVDRASSWQCYLRSSVPKKTHSAFIERVSYIECL